jgi:hypothetical protein
MDDFDLGHAAAKAGQGFHPSVRAAGRGPPGDAMGAAAPGDPLAGGEFNFAPFKYHLSLVVVEV